MNVNGKTPLIRGLTPTATTLPPFQGFQASQRWLSAEYPPPESEDPPLTDLPK